jgi:hypothetical protein
MTSCDKDRFWVGRHQSRGLILVELSNISEEDTFPVFFVEQDRIAICKRSIMRKFSSASNVTPDEIEASVQAYLTIGDRELEKRHNEFLAKHNLAPASVRKRDKTLPIRVTHCWSCKSQLNSVTDLECAVCGWILCECGACGCPYK